MGVKFHTNLDHYRTLSDLWPLLPDGVVPRIGEYIETKKEYHKVLINRGLPIKLEVKSVTYCETSIHVDLWYTVQDYEFRDKKVLF
jgi:hypothetical protein